MPKEPTSLLLLALSGDEAVLDELVQETAQELGLGELNEIAHPAQQEEHIAAIEAHASHINNGGIERQIDPPSEAYTTLEHVERCPQLWNLLESFAREDSLTTERKGSPGAAAMSGPRDITLVVTSEEFGNEHFHYGSIPAALAAIQRLVLAAEQQADGIERLIGIVVNPGERYVDPKRAESSASS